MFHLFIEKNFELKAKRKRKRKEKEKVREKRKEGREKKKKGEKNRRKVGRWEEGEIREEDIYIIYIYIPIQIHIYTYIYKHFLLWTSLIKGKWIFMSAYFFFIFDLFKSSSESFHFLMEWMQEGAVFLQVYIYIYIVGIFYKRMWVQPRHRLWVTPPWSTKVESKCIWVVASETSDNYYTVFTLFYDIPLMNKKGQIEIPTINNFHLSKI